MNTLFFLVAWIVSGIGSILLAAVAVTYIRRTWQLIRAEEDDPTRERLLDGLDLIENQLHLMSRRLDGLEEKLDSLEGRLGPGTPEDARLAGSERLPEGELDEDAYALARESSPEESAR